MERLLDAPVLSFDVSNTLNRCDVVVDANGGNGDGNVGGSGGGGLIGITEALDDVVVVVAADVAD